MVLPNVFLWIHFTHSSALLLQLTEASVYTIQLMHNT